MDSAFELKYQNRNPVFPFHAALDLGAFVEETVREVGVFKDNVERVGAWEHAYVRRPFGK